MRKYRKFITIILSTIFTFLILTSYFVESNISAKPMPANEHVSPKDSIEELYQDIFLTLLGPNNT